MSKDFYIRLTFAVYKVIELFPEKEPLKHDIRNLANEILVNLINNNSENGSRNIESLNNLFDLAEEKNWIDRRNFLVLRREYNKIDGLSKNKEVFSGKAGENSFSNKRRRGEILNIMKQNNKTKIGILAKNFPNINRRTLLRDLDGFCQVGLVKKNGNGRGVYYIMKNATS